MEFSSRANHSCAARCAGLFGSTEPGRARECRLALQEARQRLGDLTRNHSEPKGDVRSMETPFGNKRVAPPGQASRSTSGAWRLPFVARPRTSFTPELRV